MEIKEAQQTVYEWAESKGWNDPSILDPKADVTEVEKKLALIAFIHFKLSQDLELIRAGQPTSGFLENIALSVPGFDEVPGVNVVKVLAKLALIHSEVSEATEAVMLGQIKTTTAEGKPEGLGAELSDIDIRTLHLRGMLGLDAAKDFDLKMAYNATRAKKHGKLA
jgi:hypothetical protein